MSKCFHLYIFLAIIDGVLNNEAFRHTGENSKVDTWTQLLKDLRLWEDMDTKEQLQYLRHRFVIGASEWLSGKYASK